MTKNDVFISYSRVDQDFAVQLASLLAKEGLKIWIDVEDIPPGENWRNALDEGLKTAEIMLLIISPESMASSEVQAEWNYFLDEKKTVIPIQLRPTEIPSRLRLIQRVDFSAPGAHFLSSYSRLRDRLKGADAALSGAIGTVPYSIKSAPQTATQTEPPSKDNSANRTQIIVAVIGTIGVIVAALIGLLPTLLNRPADPTPTATTPPTVAIVNPTTATTPTDAPNLSPTATTPSNTTASSLPVGTYSTTIIFNGADSLVVRAETDSNITGLVLRSANEDILLTDYFPILQAVGSVLNAGQCLMFFRSGTQPPLPRGCTDKLEFEFARGETFWYDNAANRARDLVKMRDGTVLGICSAGGGAGSCDFSSS